MGVVGGIPRSFCMAQRGVGLIDTQGLLLCCMIPKQLSY
jgi:hypothetical protein